jgi:heme-degrading monooxygenase HmoA
MIARIWKGHTRADQAADYLALMQKVALPDYLRVPGNRGAWCLHRALGADTVEITMLTFWTDMEAIRGFAGPDPGLAKYYDFDADYLLQLPPRVEHHEMLET